MAVNKKDKSSEEIHKIMNNPVLDTNIDDYAKDLYPTNLIKEINPLPNQFIYIINIKKNKIVFCSNSVEKIIGYKPEELNVELMLSNVHPDDQDIVFKAIKVAYGFGQSGNFGSNHNLLQFSYRLKHKNGSYRHFIFSGEIINTDKTNKMAYSKTSCTDITDIKTNNNISVKIHLNDKLVFSLSNDSISERKGLLTKRELLIVDFLINGLSSVQIAKKLFISRHTVDTHRRNILKKLELESTKELLL
jgi:PAS domain S-box-containing protein